MSHYARIENDLVVEVIVAEQDFVATLPGEWVETAQDGSIRKNYAGIGFTYRRDLDAFIAPKPEGDFTLNTTTGLWEPVEQ